MVSLTETRRAKRQTADRAAAIALSVTAHAAVFAFVLVSVQPKLEMPPPAEVPIPVEIMAPPPPPPPPPKPKVSRQRASAPPKTADKPAPGRPERAPIVAHKTPTPPVQVPTLAAGLVKGAPSQGAGSANGVSEGELAGAAVAGSGDGTGDGCDMAGRVQAALRKDSLVQSAVSTRGGRAIRVWNGDWVQTDSEDGHGLSAVRESILWAVGFAPRECRNESVRGLVLFKAGGARLVLGAGQWRWSDLLIARGTR
jgi:hypothetical protein